MKISQVRLYNVRCFEEVGIALSGGCNIFVGQNNCGKSTVLRAALNLANIHFDQQDVRPHTSISYVSTVLTEMNPEQSLAYGQASIGAVRYTVRLRGELPDFGDSRSIELPMETPLFRTTKPDHVIVPFVAKRKASGFSETINLAAQANLDGTLVNIYSKIDLLASAGHPKHSQFMQAVSQIVGLPITTKPSVSGKQAGFYFDEAHFVPLDRMGDGVSEMVSLIVELCTERNKIFVLEEPETNLHPRGLKALLAMVRDSAETNQFLIATHSNVVVRELGSSEDTKVFRVVKHSDNFAAPSIVEELERTPDAHLELLRDLGYEFSDLELYDGWLFLEESSAERIIRDILIPHFVPALRGRLRTFAANGVDDLRSSVAEFERLMVFIHLQPIYAERLWIRADGDEAGISVITALKNTFPNYPLGAIDHFCAEQFEHYYPTHFEAKAMSALSLTDRRQKRSAKLALLQEVIEWSFANPKEALAAWEVSAAEPIEMLRNIENKLCA